MLQGLVVALMGLGLVMIYSAQGRVDKPPMQEEFFNSQATKQMTFVLVSLVMMVIFSRIDYRVFGWKGTALQSAGVWMVALAVVLLVAVMIFGQEVNGAKRWIKIGGVTFQPSEFAKLAVVVFLAGRLSDPEYPRWEFWRGLLPLCAVIGVVSGLVAKEDLGTGAVIALVCGLMLLAGGATIWHLLLPALIAIAGFIGFIIYEPYRLKRIVSFRDLWADPEGANYHAIQSLVAIATGGWWGLGIGEGIQKYGYLPEDTTDFIFSISSEELGMAGGLTVLGIFMVFVVVGWLIYRRAADDFGRMLVFGLIGMLGLQAAINVAVATVSVPTKGIALPFVSAGGSGLIFAALGIGLVCSVSRNSDG